MVWTKISKPVTDIRGPKNGVRRPLKKWGLCSLCTSCASVLRGAIKLLKLLLNSAEGWAVNILEQRLHGYIGTLPLFGSFYLSCFPYWNLANNPLFAWKNYILWHLSLWILPFFVLLEHNLGCHMNLCIPGCSFFCLYKYFLFFITIQN